MRRKKRTYRSNTPSYSYLKTLPSYWRLVEWMATPTWMRKPPTLKELSVDMNLCNTTLSQWQNIPEFYGDVRGRIKKEMRGNLADVLSALKKKIERDGSAKEIKLFLQWADDFVEKTEVIDTQKLKDLPAPLADLVQKFEKEYKETLAKKDAPE